MFILITYLISILTWSLYPVFPAIGLGPIGPITFATIAQIISAATSLIFVLILLSRKKGRFKKINQINKIMNFDSWSCIALSGLCYAILAASFLIALDMTNKASVSVIIESWPIPAMLMAALIVKKDGWEKISGSDMLLAFIAFCGVITITIAGSSSANNIFKISDMLANVKFQDVAGAMIAFLGAMSIVLSTLFRARATHRLERKMPNMKGSLLSACYTDFLARIFSLPPMILLFLVANEPFAYSEKSMIFVVLTGVLCNAVSSISYMIVLLKSKSPNFHIYWFMLPILSLFWLWAFGLETINAAILISAGIIVCVNMALAVKNTNKRHPQGISVEDIETQMAQQYEDQQNKS